MSNGWSIEVFPPDSVSHDGAVRSALDIFKSAKLEPLLPHTGFISVISADGISDLRFQNGIDLVDYLGANGGLVAVWHTGSHFDGHLMFDWGRAETGTFIPDMRSWLLTGQMAFSRPRNEACRCFPSCARFLSTLRNACLRHLGG